MGVPAERIHFVGNPMIDTLMTQRARFDPAPERERLGLPATYGVVTLHRPSNVDDIESARAVVGALDALAARLPLVIPLHPRGAARLAEAGLHDGERLRIVEPLGYVAFLSLVAGARLVLTDSGGIQEETTMLDVPCLTMRPNTERPITISHGTNRLVRPDEVAAAADEILVDGQITSYPPDLTTYDRTLITMLKIGTNINLNEKFGLRFISDTRFNMRKAYEEKEPRNVTEENWLEIKPTLDLTFRAASGIEFFAGGKRGFARARRERTDGENHSD